MRSFQGKNINIMCDGGGKKDIRLKEQVCAINSGISCPPQSLYKSDHMKINEMQSIACIHKRDTKHLALAVLS